jgi:hypothetical protein
VPRGHQEHTLVVFEILGGVLVWKTTVVDRSIWKGMSPSQSLDLEKDHGS